MKRSPLKRMSLRRQQTLPKYMKLRKEFLEAHPYCQHWLAESGLTEDDINSCDYKVEKLFGFLAQIGDHFVFVPRSSEIHHRRGRGKYLLDTSTWMAVSNEGHR